MFVRQVKRKCNVRGCKNTDCFAISRTREIGNTVIACKSCLGEAFGAIDEIDPKTKSNIPPVSKTAAPSLFFNAKALGAEVKVENTTPPADEQENTTSPADVEGKEAEQLEGVDPADDSTDADDTTPPATDAEDSTGDVTPPAEDTAFKCPICGKEFDSEKGLKTHLRYCKPQTDKD